jgi:hypothetical protein
MSLRLGGRGAPARETMVSWRLASGQRRRLLAAGCCSSRGPGRLRRAGQGRRSSRSGIRRRGRQGCRLARARHPVDNLPFPVGSRGDPVGFPVPGVDKRAIGQDSRGMLPARSGPGDDRGIRWSRGRASSPARSARLHGRQSQQGRELVRGRQRAVHADQRRLALFRLRGHHRRRTGGSHDHVADPLADRIVTAMQPVLRRAQPRSRAPGMTRRAQGLTGCLCTDAW